MLFAVLFHSPAYRYGVEVEDSILADVGNKISWVFYPMLGERSWGATVSAIQGIIAKEQVISSGLCHIYVESPRIGRQGEQDPH